MKTSKIIVNSAIYLLSIIQIIVLAYYNGGISPDSANYLSLAQSLVDTKSFYTPDILAEEGRSFFSVWPIGYPTLIAIVSIVTQLDVFWASKGVNIICLGLIVLFFAWRFKKTSIFYNTLIILPPIVSISYYTWSEIPFLLLLCISAYALGAYQKTGDKKWIYSLTAAAIGLFFMRYIGLFIVIPIGLYILYNIKREMKKAIDLTLSASCVAIVAGCYLLINKTLSGRLTGESRSYNENSALELLSGLTNAHWQSFYIYIIPCMIAVLIYQAIKNTIKECKPNIEEEEKIWPSFLTVGISYWIAMVGMRVTYQYDMYDIRLLSPFTYLALVAGINFLLLHKQHQKYVIGGGAIILSIFIWQNSQKIWYIKETGYSFTGIQESIRQSFQAIPENAVILSNCSGCERNFIVPQNRLLAFPYAERIAKEYDNAEEYAQKLCQNKHVKYIFLFKSIEGRQANISPESPYIKEFNKMGLKELKLIKKC